jgi:SAM-dependent methyltransferase
MTRADARAPLDIAALPFSPAAERNAGPILAQLRAWLPEKARVLEVASGTGQHAQHFAAAMPGWDWQPSEAEPEAQPVVAARCAGLPNVRRPLRLDVHGQPWLTDAAAFDAVFVANLLHIAPWDATPALMQGAARCLGPDGRLVVYGPFIVEGEPLAPSNAAFDANLRERDARWGLRSLAQVLGAAQAAGLELADRVPMPANNQMLRFIPARVPAS